MNGAHQFIPRMNPPAIVLTLVAETGRSSPDGFSLSVLSYRNSTKAMSHSFLLGRPEIQGGHGPKGPGGICCRDYGGMDVTSLLGKPF